MQISTIQNYQTNFNATSFSGIFSFYKKGKIEKVAEKSKIKEMSLREYFSKAETLFHEDPMNHLTYLPSGSKIDEIKRVCLENNRNDQIPRFWLYPNDCTGTLFASDLERQDLSIVPELLDGIKKNSPRNQEGYYTLMLSNIDQILKDKYLDKSFIERLRALRNNISAELPRVYDAINQENERNRQITEAAMARYYGGHKQKVKVGNSIIDL